MVTIQGVVGSSGKYLVTGMPVGKPLNALLKITFENKTAGTNLALCAGTAADFGAGAVGMQLSDSGGPGFQFLTIINAKQISDKVIYVKRMVGSADSQFTLIVE